jgi:dehydrogenase/reductase SDR family protein 4
MNSETATGTFSLKDRVAIITGATRGIGYAVAEALGRAGASVVITGRSSDTVDAAKNWLSDLGITALGVVCHSGDADQLKMLVQTTTDTFGRIDILVNNAAINPVVGPMETMDDRLFDKIMQVNLKAGFLLSNFCMPHLRSSGNGSVIHMSSVEGLKPTHGLGLYSISKAALIMLAKVQAGEWGEHNIRVNVICPGLVQTKFSQPLWQNEEMLTTWNQQIPLHRMAQPDEMNGLALFLASDASSYCTGGVFTCDGGYMLK